MLQGCRKSHNNAHDAHHAVLRAGYARRETLRAFHRGYFVSRKSQRHDTDNGCTRLYPNLLQASLSRPSGLPAEGGAS